MSSGEITFFFNSTPPNLGLTLMRIGTSNGNGSENLGGTCTSVGTGCLAGGDVRVTDFTNAVAANPNLRVWASAYSPPAAYTTNSSTKCASNSGLAAASYSAYATWLGNFALTMKNTYSVPLYALSVQNEPDICGVPYDQAFWTGSQMDTFIKTNLGPTFSSDSLATLIMMPEPAGNYDYNNYAGPCMTDSSCSTYVGVNSWHDYDASYSAPDSVNSPTNTYASAGKQYWETEVSNLPGTGPNAPGCSAGAWCPSISDALMWAAFIDDRLVNENANSYNYWQFMSFNNTDNEGLTQANGTVALRAYAFAQYADFVRPGMVRITTTHNPQTAVTVSAYKNTTTSAFAIIATKYSAGSISQTFAFSGVCPTTVTPYITSATQNVAVQSPVTVTSCSFTYTLPAQSITTFVGTAATNYYISNAGSDSNNGTSKATSWAHLPGMATATSNAAANVPAAGNQYILRGCDTWTNANFPLNLTWSGTSGNNIYIGVDQTWYNTTACPTSWNRPIWDAGSAMINGGTHNYFVQWNTSQYVTLDWIEMRNLFWTGHTVYGNIAYINLIGSSYSTFSNLYLHNWTHGTIGASTSDDLQVLQGSTVGGTANIGNSLLNSIIDGGAGQDSGVTNYNGFQYIENSIFEHVVSGIEYGGNFPGGGVVSGNLVYNIIGSFTGNHPNCIAELTEGLWYTFNNVCHDSIGEADFMANPGSVEYIWNNVWYNLSENPPETGATSTGNATVYFWNNTVVAPPQGGGQNCIRVGHSQTTVALTFWNNHCITNNSAAVDSSFPSPSIKNTTLMPTATATTQGYTSSQTFAYSPTLGTNSTVGAGTVVCGVLFSCTGNLLAGTSDTNYACTLATTSGGVVISSCPVRTTIARPNPPDTGAYQLSATPFVSPVTLAFSTVTQGTSSAGMSTTFSNTTSGTIIPTITIPSSTYSADFSQTNTCGSSVAANSTCTITAVFSPTALTGTFETATINIAFTGASGSPLTVSLNGTSGPPTPVATPSSFSSGAIFSTGAIVK